MAVKIRLRRMGAKKRPFYRIVVADGRSPRDGRFIELIGTYDPNSDPPIIKIDQEKAAMWLSRGAQPTDTANALLKRIGAFRDRSVEEAPAVEVKKLSKKAKAASAKAEAAVAAPPVEAAPAPAPEPVVEAPAVVEEPAAEAPAVVEEPVAAPEPVVEAPAEEPAAEAPAEEPVAEAPAEEPAAAEEPAEAGEESEKE